MGPSGKGSQGDVACETHVTAAGRRACGQARRALEPPEPKAQHTQHLGFGL